MAQHFLLSRQAKTLALASVFQMKDEEAEMTFRRIRWHETDGQPVCPHCGGVDAYDCRRLKGAPRFRCRACVKDFSITSGTLFASHKLPLRCHLAWREDNRRVSNGDQVSRVAGLAMVAKRSVDFCGYWQRHIDKSAN